MATTLIPGPYVMKGGWDADGYRTYNIEFRVESNDKRDGPAVVSLTPGLPLPGAFWLIGNDIDVWAWCRFDTSVEPVLGSTDGPNRYWKVGKIFSTKPPGTAGSGSGGLGGVPGPGGGRDAADRQRCGTATTDDPLLEPPRISGGFNFYQKEALFDRFDNRILNSAYQQIRGPSVEFEASNPIINIEMNLPSLSLFQLSAMNNSVNDRPLWGLPSRCIKLKVKSWSRQFYGTCYFYYTLSLEFEVNVEVHPDTGALRSGWDREIMDEGTKALNGHFSGNTWVFDETYDDEFNFQGEPSILYQSDFSEIVDKNGNPTTVILNGYGFPYNEKDADRSFHWVYVDGSTTSTTSGTFSAVRALLPEPVQIFGPFITADQATEASIDLGSFREVKEFPAPGKLTVQYHHETNFLNLGVPIIL